MWKTKFLKYQLIAVISTIPAITFISCNNKNEEIKDQTPPSWEIKPSPETPTPENPDKNESNGKEKQNVYNEWEININKENWNIESTVDNILVWVKKLPEIAKKHFPNHSSQLLKNELLEKYKEIKNITDTLHNFNEEDTQNIMWRSTENYSTLNNLYNGHIFKVPLTREDYDKIFKNDYFFHFSEFDRYKYINPIEFFTNLSDYEKDLSKKVYNFEINILKIETIKQILEINIMYLNSNGNSLDTFLNGFKNNVNEIKNNFHSFSCYIKATIYRIGGYFYFLPFLNEIGFDLKDFLEENINQFNNIYLPLIYKFYPEQKPNLENLKDVKTQNWLNTYFYPLTQNTKIILNMDDKLANEKLSQWINQQAIKYN